MFARPMTCLSPLATQTEPSFRSRCWAVYPLDSIATVSTSAVTMTPLVAVRASDLWVLIQRLNIVAHHPAKSTHFSLLDGPTLPARLTATMMQTRSPAWASTGNFVALCRLDLPSFVVTW